MSTIQDFENAPVGATARRPGSPVAVKVSYRPSTKGNWDDGLVKMTVETLMDYDYVLDPVRADLAEADQQLQDYTLWTVTDLVEAIVHGRVHIAPGHIPALTAPTTAREALDLAWDLAHPVKEGQVIPKGAKWMKKVAGNVREYTMGRDYTVTANDTYILRTLDRLPRPEPGWLDAPAVLAAMNDCSWQKVWLPSTPGHWECTCCGVDRHWSKMNDVTPLYPKEDKGGMYVTGPGNIQIKDRNGQTVWEI